MTSSTIRGLERKNISRFGVLAVDRDRAASSPAVSHPALLGTAFDIRHLSGSKSETDCELQLVAMNQSHDAVFVSGTGAGAKEALALAGRFPDLVDGVVLFAPELPGISCLRLLHKAADALRSVVCRITALGGVETDNDRFTRGQNTGLGSVTQPVLILHPRAGQDADISVPGYLQRDLGGPVEVLFAGPGAEILSLDWPSDAITRRCEEFMSRVAAGAEGRRLKRNRAMNANPAARAVARPAVLAKVENVAVAAG